MIYKRFCVHSIITDIEDSRTGKFNLFLNHSRNKYDEKFKSSSLDLNPYNDVYDTEFFEDLYDIFNSYKLINYKMSNTDLSQGRKEYTDISLKITRERYNELMGKYELLDFKELKSILADLNQIPSTMLLIKMYINEKITLDEIFYVIKYFSKTHKMGDLYKSLKVEDLSIIEALPDKDEEYILEDDNVKELYKGFHSLANYLKLESSFEGRDDLDTIYKIFHLHEKIEELVISNDSEYSKSLMKDDILSYLNDKTVFLNHSTPLYDETTYLYYLIRKSELSVTSGDCLFDLFDLNSPYKKGSPGFRKMTDLNRFVTTTWDDKDKFPEFHERVFKATRSLMFSYALDKVNILQLIPKHRKDIMINNFSAKLFMKHPENSGIIKLFYPYLLEYESYLSEKYGREVDALKVIMGRYEINENNEIEVDYDRYLSTLRVDISELSNTLERFNNFMVEGGNPNYKYNKHLKKALMKHELLR